MKKRVWSFIILCWWARRQLSFFCFKMLMWNELYYSFLVQHIQWVSCSSVYVQVRTNYIKAGHSWHRWENDPTCLPNSVNIPGDLMVSNASFKRLLRVFLWRQKPVFQSWCCGADVSQNSCFHPSLLFTNANRFKKHKQKTQNRHQKTVNRFTRWNPSFVLDKSCLSWGNQSLPKCVWSI